LLHNAGRASPDGPFQFQLTGDAGRTYAIQSATNLNLNSWTTLTNIPNPGSTIWFTNPASGLQGQQFFRAQSLP